MSLDLKQQRVDLCAVYRPPPSDKNKFTVNKFIDEFGDLQSYASNSTPVVFLGDFNFHLDNGSDANANRFTSLLHSLDFEQHVSSPTHRSGHTLDAIISRSGYGLVSNVHVGDLFSDHCLILCSLSHTKIPRPRKTVSIRKWRTIDIPAFTSDVGDCLALVPISAASSQLLSSLSTIFTDVLDAHAPQSFKDIVIRPPTAVVHR